MSNDLANCRVTLSFPAPGGGTSGPQAMTALPPFKACSTGKIDVPAGTLTGVTYPIPFGSIGVAATLAMIKNTCDRPVLLKINGSSSLVELAANDGLFLYAGSEAPGGTPLTSLSIVTDGTHTNSGQISYWVFGDPE
jgi:hypothetical protein